MTPVTPWPDCEPWCEFHEPGVQGCSRKIGSTNGHEVVVAIVEGRVTLSACTDDDQPMVLTPSDTAMIAGWLCAAAQLVGRAGKPSDLQRRSLKDPEFAAAWERTQASRAIREVNP